MHFWRLSIRVIILKSYSNNVSYTFPIKNNIKFYFFRLGGILVLVLEIPILFGLFDLMKPLANLSQRLEPWQKMIVYLV